MVTNLALFFWQVIWLLSKKLGGFFQNHLVTLRGLLVPQFFLLFGLGL
jgi:hypothetical protein